MLLMVDKDIRERICSAIHWYTKANNKYMRDYDLKKELPYLKYWNVKNLYGWVMSQKLPLNEFRLVENISEFDERFIKNLKKVMKDISSKLIFNN